MNHEILIETEVDGEEPYAGLLRRVIPAALEAEGVSFPCEVDVLFTDDEGIHAINLGMRGVDRPTAFFCTNDTIAAGAMKAVTRAGLRVPEDIAIIGFDDSYISRVVEPELTTVRIDAAKMGCLAMQTLFDLIAGMPVEKAHIQIPTELIVRGTA